MELPVNGVKYRPTKSVKRNQLGGICYGGKGWQKVAVTTEDHIVFTIAVVLRWPGVVDRVLRKSLCCLPVSHNSSLCSPSCCDLFLWTFHLRDVAVACCLLTDSWNEKSGRSFHLRGNSAAVYGAIVHLDLRLWQFLKPAQHFHTSCIVGLFTGVLYMCVHVFFMQTDEAESSVPAMYCYVHVPCRPHPLLWLTVYIFPSFCSPSFYSCFCSFHSHALFALYAKQFANEHVQRCNGWSLNWCWLHSWMCPLCFARVDRCRLSAAFAPGETNYVGHKWCTCMLHRMDRTCPWQQGVMREGWIVNGYK